MVKSPNLLFVVADVSGPNHYHLGDEAMLEANLGMFRQLTPGIKFILPSGDPAWTSRHYEVEALAMPPVPHGVSASSWASEIAHAPDRSARLESWLGPEITGNIRRCCGMIVSGGGNLSLSWPEKVLERVALLEYAQEMGLPTVVLGQTLGPALTPEQRSLLSPPLQRSAWIGVRDDASAALAAGLGVSPDRIHKQLDDAFFLDPLPVTDERAAVLGSGRLIAVTVDASFGSPERKSSLDVLASQLDSLADGLQADLVFIPHVGGADAGDNLSDLVVGRALAARMQSRLILLDLWQPREVRWLIERSCLVISTRYHALVFAAAAGIPALGIYTDEYTRTKLRGALTPAGLEGWCMSLADAERGALLPLASELWYRWEQTSNRLKVLRNSAWPWELKRWSEINAALQLVATGTPKTPSCVSDAPAFSVSRAALPLPLISDEQWAQYDRDGYLRLGRMLNAEELSALQRRMDDIMLGQVRYPTLQMQLDTGGAYEDLPEPSAGLSQPTLGYRKIQGLEADPLVLGLVRHPLFREICGRHYGCHTSISIFRAMLMNKPASKGTHLPWHQDAGDVWKLDRDPLVTMWVALDPANRMNGCVQVIPGTHRLGLLSKNGSTISPEHVKLHCPEDRIEYLELEAGEGLLLHNWLLHRSDVNHTAIPRRALSACYMDGRTLGVLTGTRFPIVFGENDDVEYALPFVRGMREENQQLRDMAIEANRHANSLLEDNRRREELRCETERYALSLLEDNRLREQMRLEAERYAKALEEELTRLRGIAVSAAAN